MQYSILIYATENVFDRLPEADQKQYLQDHVDLQADIKSKGSFGVARLMAADCGVTVVGPNDRREKPMVVDGPFSETKEHFMGFYVVDCASLEDAIEMASRIATPFHRIEVRPVAWAGGVLSNE